MASLELKNVSKQFPNGKLAIDDFSISVPHKEFIAVVGPSGCGKTTLLRLIAGLEIPTFGEILMDGVNVNKLKPNDRSVTLVFQSYALFPYMTAYQNMAFGLKISGTPKEEIDKKVREAASVLGIEGELGYKPRELSGGQKQRVALGRAMVMKPKFFLFDEPLASLDAKLRAEMRSQILDLYSKLDATFIYVTHDQVEAMTMGERIVVINEGKAVQIAPPREVYDFPTDKFVAEFIGLPQMNFFDGTLSRDGDKVVLNALGTRFEIPLSCDFDGQMQVTVGIRAEDIELSGFGLDATINSVEFQGRDVLLYVSVGENTLVCKTTGAYARGEHVNLSLGVSKFRFFDPNSKKSIRL